MAQHGIRNAQRAKVLKGNFKKQGEANRAVLKIFLKDTLKKYLFKNPQKEKIKGYAGTP